MTVSINISMFFKERVAASVRKFAADIFFVCGYFGDHFNVF